MKRIYDAKDGIKLEGCYETVRSKVVEILKRNGYKDLFECHVLKQTLSSVAPTKRQNKMYVSVVLVV